MKFLDRLGVDKSSFTDLFSACLGCGARVQEAGSKLIVKSRRWSVDLKRGEISFGDDAPRAIWYIGSEASSSRTWLWRYENINRLDERLLTLARDVRDFGLWHGLAELSTPKLALSAEINGHALSAIVSELVSLARDYIGAFRLNYAVLSGALLLRNGTKFSEAAGKIVANFKNDALFSFNNLGRLSEAEFAV